MIKATEGEGDERLEAVRFNIEAFASRAFRRPASDEEVDRLMARQGHVLERVAIEELIARRGRLENYRDKARFALADSYDRATQAQARVESE